LYPESGEWLRYLADLTKKQGEHLKTGFEGFDGETGGLGPGLLLLGGKEQSRVLDFLKQLVDQIAIRCRVPCLYLSFERSKADLRLQTLSRLSGAGADRIRSGKFNKDSNEWQNIIRTGEQAVEWLQRIYVVESSPGLAVTRMRELRQSLIGSGAGASCLIAVDNLDKLSNESDLLQSVAELKELAESLGIVVIGAASSPIQLVHEKSADMAAIFTESDGEVVLEVRTPGEPKPRVLHFDYQPGTHRFAEISPVVS
jgi:replicative DNA helicase